MYLPICQSVYIPTPRPYFPLISLGTDPSPLVSHKLFENWEHLWISVSKVRNAAQLLIEYIHGRKRHFIRIQIVPLKDLRVMISLAVACISSFMRNQKRSENGHIWLGFIGFPTLCLYGCKLIKEHSWVARVHRGTLPRLRRRGTRARSQLLNFGLSVSA